MTKKKDYKLVKDDYGFYKLTRLMRSQNDSLRKLLEELSHKENADEAKKYRSESKSV